MSRYQIAIIGSSTGSPKHEAPPPGLEKDGSRELFEKMVETAEKIITVDYGLAWDQVHLISGGAAWSDHIAVVLFLKHRLEGAWITIFSPVEWNAETGKFYDNGRGTVWKTNPGYLANVLHEKFARVIERDTFNDLRATRYYGGNINTNYSGFHHRNSAVANCAHLLLAFSWATGTHPESGGTLDTWNKSKTSQKKHISLSSLLPASPVNPAVTSGFAAYFKTADSPVRSASPISNLRMSN